MRRSASEIISNLETRIAQLEKSSGRGDRLQEKHDHAEKLKKALSPIFGNHMDDLAFDYGNSDMFIAYVDESFWEDGLLGKDLRLLAKHTDGFSIEGDRVFLNIK
jgi:hypothetical protein